MHFTHWERSALFRRCSNWSLDPITRAIGSSIAVWAASVAARRPSHNTKAIIAISTDATAATTLPITALATTFATFAASATTLTETELASRCLLLI